MVDIYQAFLYFFAKITSSLIEER